MQEAQLLGGRAAKAAEKALAGARGSTGTVRVVGGWMCMSGVDGDGWGSIRAHACRIPGAVETQPSQPLAPTAAAGSTHPQLPSKLLPVQMCCCPLCSLGRC